MGIIANGFIINKKIILFITEKCFIVYKNNVSFSVISITYLYVNR